MAVAFFCEELANIKSLRAVVGVDANNVNLKDQLSLKDNTLFAGNVPVISFNANNLHVDPRLLLMTPQASPTCGGSIVEAKMTVSDSKMDTMDDDLKVWWPVKELETMQGFTCRTCNTRLATTSGFRCKALPSEHWYELVECWICHETKPEEHRARMQPISARPQTLLAGTTYLLIHPDDLKNDQQQVSVVMNEASTLSPDKVSIIPTLSHTRILRRPVVRKSMPNLVDTKIQDQYASQNSLWKIKFSSSSWATTGANTFLITRY